MKTQSSLGYALHHNGVPLRTIPTRCACEEQYFVTMYPETEWKKETFFGMAFAVAGKMSCVACKRKTEFFLDIGISAVENLTVM